LDEIQELVAKGYIVRTRSEDGTKAAKEGDVSQMDAAFASGAQIISTTYYRADERSKDSEDWSDYAVQFPNDELAIVNFMNGDSSTLVTTATTAPSLRLRLLVAPRSAIFFLLTGRSDSVHLNWEGR